MYRILRVIAFPLLLLCFSCSREKPAEVAGSKPPDAVTAGPSAKSAQPAGDKGTQAVAVQAKNSPPEINNIRLLPEVFKAGDVLNVEVSASDADGDDVSILYAWTKNGEPSGITKSLSASVKRGDKISVKVMPFDGKVYGRPVVLEREILNLPPIISEDNNFVFDGKIFTYQVKASDPDGDILSYALKTVAPGLAIDSSSGLIIWNVPPDFKGKLPLIITVADGHKGEAIYTLNVTIGVEAAINPNPL